MDVRKDINGKVYKSQQKEYNWTKDLITWKDTIISAVPSAEITVAVALGFASLLNHQKKQDGMVVAGMYLTTVFNGPEGGVGQVVKKMIECGLDRCRGCTESR